MDAQTIVDRMVKNYGDKIADPDVFPKIFKFQVMMTKREILFEQQQATQSSQPPTET